MLAGALIALGLAVAGSGCKAKTDLGQPCILVRKDPSDTDPSDGIRSIDILEDEVTPGKDFVSFGSTECDDLVCVRDASDPPGEKGTPAQGFCTRPCVQASETSCLTGDDQVDRETPFTCRSLLLDEDTLASIKQADPQTYQRYFGDTQSPYFCARPRQAPTNP
ncbi:MAG: adventurous gliding motility lipoprotein CglC [Myxococcaceae bacterium]|nr:adventurous gliding motility lipoprotein CglC [Myxococcaceae bacterium]